MTILERVSRETLRSWRVHMSEAQEREILAVVQRPAAEVENLRERIEDLEDAKELNAAVARNGEKPLVPWDKAKSELGLL